MSNNRLIEILLVEDNEGDILLTKEAFRETKTPCNITVARNGIEGLQALSKEGFFLNSPTPDLILLDINMPKMNGIEVLEKIKQNLNFVSIPVIMFSTSSSDEDVQKCYKLNANCFITKPVTFDHFVEIVYKIESFWFDAVVLPRKISTIS